MVIISTSEVKDFIKKSSKINTSRSVIPVLTYIKLECEGDKARLIKTDLNTWCLQEVDADFMENITVLIEEKVLTAVIANGADDIISITQDNNTVRLKSGKANASFSLQDSSVYPMLPEMNQENGITELPTELLYSIRSASSIADTSSDSFKSLVFVKYVNAKTDVFCTSGHVIYLKQFPQRLPSFSISPVNAAMICAFELVHHYECGNYNFFNCGKTIYGFVKSTFNPPAYHKMVTSINNERYFEAEKDDLLQFCNLTSSINNDELPEMLIKDSGLGITMKSSNGDGSRITDADLLVDKNFTVPEIRLNPVTFSQVVKSISGTKIRLSPLDRKHAYSVFSTEEEGLITIMTGIFDPAKS